MLSLVCPFCDEPTKIVPGKRVMSANRIYTLRECTEGHTMYSVEHIPANQESVERAVETVKQNNRAKRKKKVRATRRAHRLAVKQQERLLKEQERARKAEEKAKREEQNY